MTLNKILIGIAVLVVLFAGYSLLFSDNSRSQDIRADGSFEISTSFYPLAFALGEITGDLATITNIGEGRDPHDFRPSVQNIATLQDSDLVVLQGADFETWGDDIIEQLENENVPVFIATEGLDLMEGGHDHGHEDEHGHEEETHSEDEHSHEEEHGHEDEHSHEEDHEHEHADEQSHEDGHSHEDHSHEGEHDHDHEEESHEDHGHEHGAFDPHTWLDPVLFAATVESLAAKLSELDPANASTYEANAAAFLERLQELNGNYENTLSNCSLDEVITSHDAFGYLGERYNFEIHSIAGLSTQDTPSSVTLAELREEAEEGIGAILLEENSISAYGETLARETGLETLPINPIAYVIPAGENYFTLMDANLATLSEALQCNG